jgi:hypothetical protein
VVVTKWTGWRRTLGTVIMKFSFMWLFLVLIVIKFWVTQDFNKKMWLLIHCCCVGDILELNLHTCSYVGNLQMLFYG